MTFYISLPGGGAAAAAEEDRRGVRGRHLEAERVRDGGRGRARLLDAGEGLVQVAEAEDVDRGGEDALQGRLQDQAEGEEGQESGEALAKQVGSEVA